MQNAVICPACDGLCVRAAQYEESQTRGAQQARSLVQELGTIVAYPLRDPIGLAMLALFTWVFDAMEEGDAPPSRAGAAGFVLLFALGVLWKLVYTPVALVVAALSRSFFKVLNPLLGVDTIGCTLGLAVFKRSKELGWD